MPKKYEMSFELNGDIDPRISRTFDSLSKDVTDLGKDFNSLQRTKGFRKVTQDAQEAQGAFHDLRQDVKEFGEVFEKTLQFTGAHTIITKVSGMFSNMVSDVGSLDDSVHHMGAATGATVQEMAQFKDVIQDIYETNIGEGFNDIADALVNVRQVTGQTGAALENTTKNALILKDTFGYDVNETVRTTDALMRNMGLTADQAFNLIAQGSQKGLDRSGDFLDTINEYSVQFKDAGYNAEEMFSILESGIKKGAFNLDKMGDLLKEFNIRIKSGDKVVTDSLDQLFAPEDIEQFIGALSKGGAKVKEFRELSNIAGKDVAKRLVTSLKKGGATAAKASSLIVGYMSDSSKIIDGLADATIRPRDALDSIIKQLDKVNDANVRNELSVGLFGTQFEDLRASAVAALQDTNGEFNKTLDTMKQIEGVKYSSLTKDIQKLGKELMTDVVIPIGEDLMPVLRDMTAWASDNKDVIKTLALGVPAAMLTKNAVSMSKDFAKVGKSLFDTTGGVSKFGKALSLMTNPVGIAVGALGLITTGVIAYKHHQEEARQELINMGDSLQKSFDDYGAVEHHTKRTQNLIREYDRLTDKINNTKTPAAELTEARRKLADVEKELIDLNPEILKAEDAKKDSFRGQLGYLDKLNQTQLEMTRRDLESEVMDKQDQLPQLVDEYKDLQDSISAYDQTYQDALKSRAQYREFINQRDQILSSTLMGSDTQNQQLTKLAESIRQQTGKDYAGKLGTLEFDLADFIKTYDKAREKVNGAQSDIEEIKKSYQETYDAQLKLIEMQDLGGQTIENQAAQYSKMTDAEKKRFDQAMREIQNLNSEMNELPLSKQIDLNVIWTQAGFDAIQAAQKSLTGKPNAAIKKPQITAYAEGDKITRPTVGLLAEAGYDEYAIPINNSKRSRGLWAEAGAALGMNPFGGSFAPVYNPQITIQGNADAAVVKSVLKDSQREWEQNMAAWKRQQERRNLA